MSEVPKQKGRWRVGDVEVRVSGALLVFRTYRHPVLTGSEARDLSMAIDEAAKVADAADPTRSRTSQEEAVFACGYHPGDHVDHKGTRGKVLRCVAIPALVEAVLVEWDGEGGTFWYESDCDHIKEMRLVPPQGTSE